MKVCILSENLSPPLDEGKKKLVHCLVQALTPRCQVLGVSIGREKLEVPGVVHVSANKLFLSRHLRAALRRFRPQVLCYVPSSSLTTMSFIRCAVIRAFQPKAKLVVINLQPRPHPRLLRWLLRPLRPDLVFAQDEATLQEMAELGCATRFLPSGVDLERFGPVPPEKKLALRRKFGVAASKFTVLHAGHIKARRNVGLLKELPSGVQAMLVAGTSKGQDGATARELRERGVIVVDTYLERVEEVYQLADCYLFPVQSPDESIGVPLSVLEAMACNLPVVTYPFGGLPRLFEEGHGLFYASNQRELIDGLKKASQLPSVHTRAMVESLSWDHVASRFLAEVESLVSAGEADSHEDLVHDRVGRQG